MLGYLSLNDEKELNFEYFIINKRKERKREKDSKSLGSLVSILSLDFDSHG